MLSLVLVATAHAAPLGGATFGAFMAALPPTPVGRAAFDAGVRPPDWMVERVAVEIGQAWQVAPSEVQLAWGRLPDPALLAEPAPLRITGRGLDGWFAVIVDAPHPAAAVLRVRAGVMQPIAVAVRPLGNGRAIVPGDLRIESTVHWGPSAALVTLPEPGWEIRRPIAPGEHVMWPAVAPPALVASGRPVLVTWNRGAVKVSLTGTALNAARNGGALRVRVPGRLGTLPAIATAPGAAALNEGGR